MRRSFFALLLVVGACAPDPPALEELLAAGYRERQQGDLQAARDLANAGRRRALEAGDTLWQRRFDLLDAEVLIDQHRDAEALPVLGGVIAAGERDRLEARALLTRGLARCYSGEGADAFRLAEIDLAVADRLAAELQSDDLAGWVRLRRGSCADVGGHLEIAEAHFRAALATARQEKDRPLEATAAGSLGFIRARGGRFDDATDWFERSLAVSSTLGSDLLEAKTLINLGWCSYELGDYEQALGYLERAEGLTAKRQQTGDLQIALQSLGNTHYRLGDLQQAGRYYERALALARDLGNQRTVAQLVSNLGYLAIAESRFDDAQQQVSEALRIKDAIGDLSGRQHSLLAEGQILEGRDEIAAAEARYRAVIGSPHADAALLWEARATLASLLVEAGRAAEAEAEFSAAFAIMEESRSQIRKTTHKITFFSSLSRFYDQYVDFLVEDGRPETALEVADRSRARLLREGLGRERPLPPGRTARFRQIARDLDAVLLAYWLAPDRSFLWVVTPECVALHVLPGEETIRARVERHQARIHRSRDPLAERSDDAIWLYETLVAPAEPATRPGGRVLVVPDGALHQINLETLVVRTPEPHYWIEDVTLSAAPSLSLLLDGVGDPLPPPTDGLLVIGDAVSPSPEFPRLAHAPTEIERVAAPFAPPQVTVYSGARAEPAIYRRAEPGRYSLIHFAAHATANRERPLDSAVILSARDDSYKLYARDIMEVPLRAELVTLSACRSAGSRAYAGEGLVGLAWAFLSSGAQDVIAGLWNVEDSSTADLMGELYRGLARSRPPDEALRAAKLTLLRGETAHRKPFYWAPFVVYTQRGRPAAVSVAEAASTPR